MTQDAILCVDDEAIILMSLKQEIKDHFGDRFQYEIAINADEALDIMDTLLKEGINPVLIITDWLMPGKNGNALIAEAALKYPKIKGIVVTGHVDHESLAKAAQNINIFSFVNKPWKKDELVNEIEKALAK
jgi:DNA-binding NtrC family response regulator